MNGIIGFSKLLARPNLSQEKHLKYLNVIENSGKQLLFLINNVLDLSKIETNQLKISIVKVELNSIINDIYELFKPSITSKGLKFIKKVGNKDVNVIGDRARLVQVFSNIISNAIKFTLKGAIKIGYEVKGSYVQCFISDTGPGIESNELQNIFLRFHQTDSGIKEGSGTGIGLAIAKGIIVKHGGEIWVESEVGKGTTFYFTIKLLK